MAYNRRKIGADHERIAEDYLVRQGYDILERNYYTRRGEIDLIASDTGTIVFVEVKYRRGKTSGYPEEAVTRTKMRRISCAAACYITQNRFAVNRNYRFDVIAIDGKEIRHYKDAFPYCG